jgi:cyclopropane fatty-acyl-phospholipid synthase-like methyltransferase
MSTFLKGIHYNNLAVYNTLTFLKLGFDYYTRFKIASGYIKPGESVLDLCAGDGSLSRFLPSGCRYECVELSPAFSSRLSNRSIPNHKINLHEGITGLEQKFDAAVMLISLCHFRETSIHSLLEELKNTAKRVIIIEDVLPSKRAKNTLLQRTMNYLCSTNYYVPLELFTADNFGRVMDEHGYTVTKHTKRYHAGFFERSGGSVFS